MCNILLNVKEKKNNLNFDDDNHKTLKVEEQYISVCYNQEPRQGYKKFNIYRLLFENKKLMLLKFYNFTSQVEGLKECDVDAIISSIFTFSQLWKI